MIRLLGFVLLACLSFAQTTPNIGLEKPPTGTIGWDIYYNRNWDRLDAMFKSPLHADRYTSLSAAIVALGGRGEVYLSCGDYPVSATIPINLDGIRIRGSGYCSNISVTGITDVFQVSAALFRLEDVQISIDTTSPRVGSAIVHATSAAGAQGYIGNVRAAGNVGSINNGFFFLNDSPGAGLWIGENLRIINNGPWQAFLKLTSSTSTSIADSLFSHLASGAKWVDAGILIDGYIDTFKISDSDLAAPSGTTGPTVWVRNTVGAGTNPRHVHFNNVSIEAAGTQKGIQLDAARTFRYINGYISAATIGVEVGPSTRDIDISHTEFISIQNQGVTVDQLASHVLISNDTFTDVGIATTNTYNCVEVKAGNNDTTVDYNHFRIFASANTCKNAIAVLAGSSTNVNISNNDIPSSTWGTAAISHLGTGADKVVWGNTPVSANGILFANLGSQSNGTILYCPDCTIANPCAGSGTGAYAKRLNGIWVCN